MLNSVRTCLLAGVSILAAIPAVAQTPEQTGDNAEVYPGEILVTAQKRVERLQDVPISITAISQDQIENLGSPRMRDLEYSVPNLLIRAQGEHVRPTVIIRGISSTDRNPGYETAVGTYIDGVFQGRGSGFNQNIADVERVEVLKGPQGTLYGKNTIAGAVNIATIKPGDEFSGRALARIGNYDSYEGNAYVTGPLVDGKLFGKVSVFGGQRDGYVKNLADNSRAVDKKEYGARAQLRFVPSDTLEFLFSVDASHDESNYVDGEVIDGVGVVPGTLTINQGDGLAQKNLRGASLAADYELGNGGTFTSITAFRQAKTNWNFDVDRTPDPIIFASYNDNDRNFTQELRYASPSDGPLVYVLGLFYMHQNAKTVRPITLDETAIIGFDSGDEYLGSGNVKTDAYAAFLNVTYSLTDTLKLIGGARYNYEKKRLNYAQDGHFLFGLPDVAGIRDSKGDSDISPTIGLSFEPNRDLTLYSKVSWGYKSGGWNADLIGDTNGDGDVTAADISFGPEKVISYESGLKTTLLDGRLRFNLAAFYLEYDDLQVSQFNVTTATYTIRNAASAKSKGFEIEASADVTREFSMNFGVGYTDATFSNFPDANPAGDNYKGRRLTAPKWTFNASTKYEKELDSGNRVFAVAGLTYRGPQFSEYDNNAFSRLKGYALLDARLGWSFSDDQLEVSLWARNLLDKSYNLTRYREALLYPQTIGTYGMPRTYGVQVLGKF